MTRPRVLCVDDSEAILALEQAALSTRYAVSTAADGQAALDALAREVPDCLVLDLSMPVLDGDQVLARVRRDPALTALPVVIVSSETRRADDCLRAGATAFLPKPLRVDALLEAVGRALAGAVEARRRRALHALPIGIGDVELAIPLEHVVTVTLVPETSPLPGGPPHLRRVVDIRGRPVAVLELARLLGLRHAERHVDRRLVIIERSGVALGLLVDRVADPIEAPPEQVTPRERLGGGEHPPLRDVLLALIARDRGPLPVLDPCALLDPALLSTLPRLLAGVRLEPAS